MERTAYLENTVTLPRMTVGQAIRHSPGETTASVALSAFGESWAPLCMSAREYRGWHVTNDQLDGTVRAERPA